MFPVKCLRRILSSDGTSAASQKERKSLNQRLPIKILISVTFEALFDKSSFVLCFSKVCVRLHEKSVAPLILVHMVYLSEGALARLVEADRGKLSSTEC